MLTSGIIDLAIGLTFVFGVTAALASLVTELISRFMGLRGAYLLSGLRELVDDGSSDTSLVDVTKDYQNTRRLIQSGPAPAASSSSAGQPSAIGALLGGPILSSQGVAGQFSDRKFTLGPSRGTGRLPKMTAYGTGRPSQVTAGQGAGKPGAGKPGSGKPGAGKPGAGKPEAGKPEAGKPEAGKPEAASRWRLWGQRRSLPSYISSRSFADAVIDLLVPDSKGQTTMATIKQNIMALPMPFRSSMNALAKNAGDDVSRFRASVEQWYDDHMDRVSGWYKRHVAKITLVFGAILVVLLNLNALTIGRTLYTESAVGAAISTVAGKVTSCSGYPDEQECLANLEGQLSAAATAGLPIGWGTVRDCAEPNARCNWWDRRGIFSQHGGSFGQLVLVIIGFLIMIIAIVPGAQFWFGLLSKLNTLRTTGPKPTTPETNPLNLTVSSPPSATSTASPDIASTDIASTQAASTDIASTQATSTDIASTQAASTDTASTDTASTDAASTGTASTEADAPSDAAAQSPQPEQNPPGEPAS